MQQEVSVVSLIGSAFSTIVTGYFWFVKMRNERPNLKLFGSRANFELGVLRESDRFVNYRVDVIVANYSSRPNAILRANLRWQAKNGQWVEFFSNPVAAPVNLLPLTTSLLSFSGTMKFPDSAEGVESGNERRDILESQFAHRFTRPMKIRVELQTLHDKGTATELTIDEWTAG